MGAPANSERDVEPEALALAINNLASDETGNQTKNNPANDTHVLPPRMPEARRPNSRLRRLGALSAESSIATNLVWVIRLRS